MFKKLTKQEIFDKVWTRFVVQKKPLSFVRVKPSNIIYCTFRGANDARDPVGMFIPNENYQPWMDEVGGYTLKSFLLELKTMGLDQENWVRIFADNTRLFEDLQEVHDEVAKFVKPRRRLGAIASRLRKVATKHKLIVKE